MIGFRGIYASYFIKIRFLFFQHNPTLLIVMIFIDFFFLGEENGSDQFSHGIARKKINTLLEHLSCPDGVFRASRPDPSIVSATQRFSACTIIITDYVVAADGSERSGRRPRLTDAHRRRRGGESATAELARPLSPRVSTRNRGQSRPCGWPRNGKSSPSCAPWVVGALPPPSTPPRPPARQTPRDGRRRTDARDDVRACVRGAVYELRRVNNDGPSRTQCPRLRRSANRSGATCVHGVSVVGVRGLR